MMNEYIYSLFVTNEQGWSLFGTLRIRYLNTAAATAVGNVPLPAAETLQPAEQELTLYPIDGSISISLLSGLRTVPLIGGAFGTAAGQFSFALSSSNAMPSVGLQMFPLGGDDLTGFVIWGGNVSQLVFSLLARQLPRTN